MKLRVYLIVLLSLAGMLMQGVARAASPTATPTKTATPTATLTATPTPSATPTPVAISAAAPTTTILQAAVSAHLGMIDAVALTEPTGNSSYTIECCTAGTSCATGCTIISYGFGAEAHQETMAGTFVCPAANMDLCLVTVGSSVTGSQTTGTE